MNKFKLAFLLAATLGISSNILSMEKSGKESEGSFITDALQNVNHSAESPKKIKYPNNIKYPKRTNMPPSVLGKLLASPSKQTDVAVFWHDDPNHEKDEAEFEKNRINTAEAALGGSDIWEKWQVKDVSPEEQAAIDLAKLKDQNNRSPESRPGSDPDEKGYVPDVHIVQGTEKELEDGAPRLPSEEELTERLRQEIQVDEQWRAYQRYKSKQTVNTSEKAEENTTDNLDDINTGDANVDEVRLNDNREQRRLERKNTAEAGQVVDPVTVNPIQDNNQINSNADNNATQNDQVVIPGAGKNRPDPVIDRGEDEEEPIEVIPDNNQEGTGMFGFIKNIFNYLTPGSDSTTEDDSDGDAEPQSGFARNKGKIIGGVAVAALIAAGIAVKSVMSKEDEEPSENQAQNMLDDMSQEEVDELLSVLENEDFVKNMLDLQDQDPQNDGKVAEDYDAKYANCKFFRIPLRDLIKMLELNFAEKFPLEQALHNSRDANGTIDIKFQEFNDKLDQLIAEKQELDLLKFDVSDLKLVAKIVTDKFIEYYKALQETALEGNDNSE